MITLRYAFRSCWFKVSITLRIDKGNTFIIIIYVYFMIVIQDIYLYKVNKRINMASLFIGMTKFAPVRIHDYLKSYTSANLSGTYFSDWDYRK